MLVRSDVVGTFGKRYARVGTFGVGTFGCWYVRMLPCSAGVAPKESEPPRRTRPVPADRAGAASARSGPRIPEENRSWKRVRAVLPSGAPEGGDSRRLRRGSRGPLLSRGGVARAPGERERAVPLAEAAGKAASGGQKGKSATESFGLADAPRPSPGPQGRYGAAYSPEAGGKAASLEEIR